MNPLTRRIAQFLNGIGIEVIQASICEETFLPGIAIENGRLLVDESKLEYPGDLLHEAGHLAVAPASLRRTLSGEINLVGGNLPEIESYAIAWSYAAALHLGVSAEVVFHEGGYKGQSAALLKNFRLGIYIGAHGLVEAGMTASFAQAQESGVRPYPHILKWLRN